MKYLHILLFFTIISMALSCKNEPKNTVTKPEKNVSTPEVSAENKPACTFKVADQPEKPRKIRYDVFEDMLDIDDDVLYIYNFWSADCASCLEQMSCFEKIVQEIDNKKVQLVFVNMDSAKELDEKVTPVVNKMGLSAKTVILDVAKPEMVYDVIDPDWKGQLPATLFVDNSTETWLFYQKKYSFDELRAQIQPLAMLKTL